MGDNVFTNVDIKSVEETFRAQGISEEIIKIAIEDINKGLPKDKVMIYVSAGNDVECVRSMSKALSLGASEKIVQRIGRLDKFKREIVFREIGYGVPEDTIISILSRNTNAHKMDQMFKSYRENMANTVPVESEKSEPNQDTEKSDSADEVADKNPSDTSAGGKNKEGSGDNAKVYIKSEDIADALGPVLQQISEHMMQQFTQAITPVIEAIPKPAADKAADRSEEKTADKSDITDKKPEVVAEADRTIIKEESARPRMVFVDMPESNKGNKEAQTAVTQKPESGTTAVKTAVSTDNTDLNMNNSGSTRSASNVIDFTGDYHMYLTTPDGRNIPVHVDQTKPKKPKNVISIAERFFKGSPSQKSLLRMLIEGRLNPEQLKQIQRAKEASFSDMELKDLIECGLPAEEMSGIIDVVMTDKRVAV